MPIKRKQINQFDTWDRILSMAKDTIRLIQQPLTDLGWKNLIAKDLDIDIDTATHVIETLIEEGVLIFTRMRSNKAIYINDRTPEFKRYMWSDDILI